MSFTSILPQTGYEALLLLVPFMTTLLGLAYLIAPRRMLNLSGLQAKAKHPDAISEGRASYGGVLLAFGASCLFLQEPQALQPGLNTMLSIAWLITGLGYLVQIIQDKQWQIAVFVKLIIAFVFFGIVWSTADPVKFGLFIPNQAYEWVLSAIAGFTTLLGLIALFSPEFTLKIIRLERVSDRPSSILGLRGVLGGFYVAAGIGFFIIVEPGFASFFLLALLGAVWLFTAIGRLISMFLDPTFLRGFTVFNVAGLIFEFCLGSGLIYFVFFGWV